MAFAMRAHKVQNVTFLKLWLGYLSNNDMSYLVDSHIFTINAFEYSHKI